MIAVIKGDIIASRKLKDAGLWLNPLKALFSTWGKSPKQWEIVWGDFFQIEFGHPEEVLQAALRIKALIKMIVGKEANRQVSPIGVRMSIGIGKKSFSGTRVSESNGPAFIAAGEQFDQLKKEKTQLAIRSPWQEFDEEINLYLRLAGAFMDSWSATSAELVAYVLEHPEDTQQTIGKALGIRQNSVSGRWKRARIEEVLKIETVFRTKLKQLQAS